MPDDAGIVLPVIAAVGFVVWLSVNMILRAEGRLRDRLERAATAATQTTAALAQRELEDWDRRLLQFTLEHDLSATEPLAALPQSRRAP